MQKKIKMAVNIKTTDRRNRLMIRKGSKDAGKEKLFCSSSMNSFVWQEVLKSKSILRDHPHHVETMELLQDFLDLKPEPQMKITTTYALFSRLNDYDFLGELRQFRKFYEKASKFFNGAVVDDEKFRTFLCLSPVKLHVDKYGTMEEPDEIIEHFESIVFDTLLDLKFQMLRFPEHKNTFNRVWRKYRKNPAVANSRKPHSSFYLKATTDAGTSIIPLPEDLRLVLGRQNLPIVRWTKEEVKKLRAVSREHLKFSPSAEADSISVDWVGKRFSYVYRKHLDAWVAMKPNTTIDLHLGDKVCLLQDFFIFEFAVKSKEEPKISPTDSNQSWDNYSKNKAASSYWDLCTREPKTMFDDTSSLVSHDVSFLCEDNSFRQ